MHLSEPVTDATIMTENSSQYALHFLGTGSGGELSMGCSAAVLEQNGEPRLLIDCGPGTLNAFHKAYHCLPAALFLTHCHMDHIADLEILTVRARLAGVAPVRLYVPVNLIALLHQRLATYPGSMAEGGHNFWQSFQLIPVQESFVMDELDFRLWATRHHAPGFSFALHLPGLFFYSGDTRPIPEILHHNMSGNETIFHDCGTEPNPSHTGLADLEKDYQPHICNKLVLYHYANESAAERLEQGGFRVARPGNRFTLPG